MEDAIPVHVVDRLQQLEHVELDPRLGYVMPPPFDCVIHIHVHEFEDHCQASGRFVANFNKLNKTALTYNKTSMSVTMFGCGDNLFKA